MIIVQPKTNLRGTANGFGDFVANCHVFILQRLYFKPKRNVELSLIIECICTGFELSNFSKSFLQNIALQFCHASRFEAFDTRCFSSMLWSIGWRVFRGNKTAAEQKKEWPSVIRIHQKIKKMNWWHAALCKSTPEPTGVKSSKLHSILMIVPPRSDFCFQIFYFQNF